MYIDFQRAFDKVPHQRLLIKLLAHAMSDSIVNWVSNWLTGRKQRVTVEGGNRHGQQYIAGFHKDQFKASYSL